MKQFCDGFGLATAALLFVAATSPLRAAEPVKWAFSGDLRVSYSAAWRDTRNGGETDSDTLGSRLRMRLRGDLNANWRVQGQFATRYDDSGNDAEFFIRSARDSATSLEPGSMTADELFVQYRTDDRRTEFRVGRMQSDFKLPLVTAKSLDRNQASNINIGWTDGIYLGHQLSERWKTTVTAQYNSRAGNATATRGPLDFSDSGSRVSAFATLESDAEIGPIFMRALTLTWYPEALATDGLQAGRRQDYIAATLKLGAGWNVGSLIGTDATRLVIAGSLGQALNRPKNAVMGIPEAGSADGFGWQLGADLVEFLPRQRVGVVFGQADAGWLISNDYRQNDSLAELRWDWQLTEPFSVQFRARWRQERKLLAGASLAQRDHDMRIRATWKF